ncbi:MAG: trmB [Ilumatobacteraceae bacterium]|nr:trmB [Ilumatobacteraceae bacterium]
MSPTRQRAFDELVPRYVLDPADVRGGVAGHERVIVEIGCGKGDATAAMAGGDAGSLVIACEPNVAMIANLALLLDEQAIDNVRLWIGDALDLLAALGPASVAEIRVWFPDPWPKPRHARKRLVTPMRLGLLIDALTIGGRLRLASDDATYADEALAAMVNDDRLDAWVVARPSERPITRFESRGLREGREAVDIDARRTC